MIEPQIMSSSFPCIPPSSDTAVYATYSKVGHQINAKLAAIYRVESCCCSSVANPAVSYWKAISFSCWTNELQLLQEMTPHTLHHKFHCRIFIAIAANSFDRQSFQLRVSTHTHLLSLLCYHQSHLSDYSCASKSLDFDIHFEVGCQTVVDRLWRV